MQLTQNKREEAFLIEFFRRFFLPSVHFRTWRPTRLSLAYCLAPFLRYTCRFKKLARSLQEALP